ncbi:MAG: dTDP-4-dehydrorhamnose reductase [Bacteroidota bacterium]
MAENGIPILVTGADGQLGNEFRKLSGGRDLELCFTDYRELNILDYQAVREFLDRNSFRYIINCAAYTAVDKAEDEPEKAYSLNADAVGNLASVTLEKSIRLIHLSTDYVFSGYMPRPLAENDEPLPETVYGNSKFEGELSLKNHPGAMIIRTSWLYSTYGNNFVKTILRKMKEQSHVKVVFDQTGSPTYARDLASAILDIIEGVESESFPFNPGVFHYANEGVCSWYDLAVEIARLSGVKTIIRPVETREYPTQAPRPWYSVLNKEKIKSVYHLTIPHWRDSLEKCIAELK